MHDIDTSDDRHALDYIGSRPNTLVCPGGKMDLALQLIFTPMIWRLVERRTQALVQD